MALNITFTNTEGFSGNYLKINPTLKNKTTCILSLEFWKDKDTRAAEGTSPMRGVTGFAHNYSFTYDLTSADNLYKQGYSFLKTLPEFAEAEDC